MNAAATGLLKSGLRSVRTQALKLVDLGDPVQTKDPITLRFVETYPNRATTWTGKGTLQPDQSKRPAVAADQAGGVQEIPVAFTAGLPATAPAAPGLYLEDASGNLYPQVTAPFQPAGLAAQWVLNLGPAL